MKKVAILAGDRLAEREISLASAQNVLDNIDRMKFDAEIIDVDNPAWTSQLAGFDAAYISCHGDPGENGRLAGYLDLIGLPYTASGVFASALTFNKFACKRYLSAFGIAIAKDFLIQDSAKIEIKKIIDQLGLPLFVKPNQGGSSYGASKVAQPDDLGKAIRRALDFGGAAIVEQFISGRELTQGIIKTAARDLILPITEIKTSNQFFDFAAKYNNQSREITPAPLSPAVANRISRASSKIYDALGCAGLIRIDYILNDNGLYFLEVNVAPGTTRTSLVPQAVVAAGMTLMDFITLQIENALTR
ncbi:MAG: D-alanine--D-alanine ligase [Candidatus Nomurabacteria bacterium]|nr:D-alanine--D-alanine ligase [Candidatus Nomurabacteria bacterium]